MTPLTLSRRDSTIEPCGPKWLRRQLLDSIDAGSRNALFAVDERRTWWSFAHIWSALIACFFAIYAVRQSAWETKISVGLFCIIFIGTRQNALGVRVHEGSHFLLFRNRRTNDLICNWLAAYWIATDICSYRAVHRRHHQFLHEENDPDRDLYLLPENGELRAVVRFFLADLVGLTALKRLWLFFSHANGSAGPNTGSARIRLAGIAAVQAVLLTTAIAVIGGFGGVINYFVFWLVPLVTVYPFIIRLRTVTEHYSDELHHPAGGAFVSRTSLTGWLERYLIGADMEFHLEHHLNPAIPHYRLRQLNRDLEKHGVFERMGKQKGKVLSDGYLRFWLRLVARKK